MTKEERDAIEAARHYAWNDDSCDAHNKLVEAVDALEKSEKTQAGLGHDQR